MGGCSGVSAVLDWLSYRQSKLTVVFPVFKNIPRFISGMLFIMERCGKRRMERTLLSDCPLITNVGLGRDLRTGSYDHCQGDEV